ncbi:MAG: AraC family ligand binding domain-containing protein, partial [Lachnospiraceae bacterium]|nr:AraC family ligand binding domain-containing protein [Lachnospiraceae bacterium]
MAGLEGCDFRRFVNYEKSDDIFLYELGTCACEPGYSYEHYIVNRCILHFIIRGKGRLVLDGHTYIVQEHQAFLIPENARAFYQADEDDPWEYVWFHIGGPKVTSILKEAGISYDNPIFTPLACAKEIEDLAFDILHNYEREYYCIGNIYKIFDYMVANSKDRVENTISNSLLYVKKVIAFVQLKYPEPIKIESIANACGLNRSYL